MSDYDVVLKTVPATLIASCTVTIPTNDQASDYLGQAYGEVWTYFKGQGAKEAGPNIGIWHQAAEVLANEVAEAAVPIDRQLPGTDRVKVYELPSAQVVSAVHQGEFENFTRLHTVLLKWIEDNNYRIVGPYREVYIQHDPNNTANSATEVQYPVEKN